MGKITGFIEHKRKTPKRRPVSERVGDWQEVYTEWSEPDAKEQASRCMDCGVPFCNNGCPLGNLIPDFNELLSRGEWKRAINELHATNNFPEFTGRICPAPCEAACTLSINRDPVTIEMIEKVIADHAWDNGWIIPNPPAKRTGRTVAIVGSGPAGLAAAQQLNRAGHSVTVFERDHYIGGLLALGIPDFKLEKKYLERRIKQLTDEGITFKTETNVGADYPTEQLQAKFDAIILSGGSTISRDLKVPGREFAGIHFAMEYLKQQNLRNRGHKFTPDQTITAKGKNVVILGGGDTGADCLGTSHRQGAIQTLQYEIMSRPPKAKGNLNPNWPGWPTIFRTSSAHEEGDLRDFGIMTTKFNGIGGNVKSLDAVRVEWQKSHGSDQPTPIKIPGSEFTVEADLVLLAMGFLQPQHQGLLDQLGVKYDERGNVHSDAQMMTSIDGVFTCGDMNRGQSLVVWAIASGRSAAQGVDKWLMGSSKLPTVKGYSRNLVNTVNTNG